MSKKPLNLKEYSIFQLVELKRIIDKEITEKVELKNIIDKEITEREILANQKYLNSN